MQRIFKDSIKPRLITPDGIDGVLAYVNGDFAWPDADIARFVNARKQVMRIDVIGNAPRKASILDVERYDATPQTAKTWVPERNAFRSDATLYSDRANLDELFATVTDPYWLWVADWTGSPHWLDIPFPKNVKLAGVQYASNWAWDTSCFDADGWHPVQHKNWTPV
ncbi:MAG TPA: hypothetical protein VH307_31185 [Streptosporangiaceae bacterium]|jgi:hypothetical protein|nr:hypothetical protein [Streptosporangiaceae bacterium]